VTDIIFATREDREPGRPLRQAPPNPTIILLDSRVPLSGSVGGVGGAYFVVGG
jgi:hypothetical protein